MWKNPLNWLLVCVPLAFVLQGMDVAAQWTFVVAALGILPLAGLMGTATEHLAEKTGPAVGGLLNATFGNAAELIIAFMLLRAGKIDVVKASITGSIIGNILLVFGLAVFLGGLRFRTQKINLTAAGMGGTMLYLSVVALVMPAILFQTAHAVGKTEAETGAMEVHLSVAISVILLFTYFCKLWFSLRTHSDLLTADTSPGEPIATVVGPHPHGAWGEGRESQRAQTAAADPVDDDEVHAHWPVSLAVGVLLGSSALVAAMSHVLEHGIGAASESFGLSNAFVGVIVIAVVGNAAEHATAVVMAMKGKMNLAITIAVESSKQIALFVAPVLVLMGLLIAPEGHVMDLNFSLVEVAAVWAAVQSLIMIVDDGETNWMEGVQLLGVYLVIACAFYFLPTPAAEAVTDAAGAHGGH